MQTAFVWRTKRLSILVFIHVTTIYTCARTAHTTSMKCIWPLWRERLRIRRISKSIQLTLENTVNMFAFYFVQNPFFLASRFVCAAQFISDLWNAVICCFIETFPFRTISAHWYLIMLWALYFFFHVSLFTSKHLLFPAIGSLIIFGPVLSLLLMLVSNSTENHVSSNVAMHTGF